MWNRAYWQAVLERMIRGAAVAVTASFIGGDVIFDAFNVNSWADVGGLALTGALTSLVLSLAGNLTTRDGPSFTNQEVVPPQ